MEYNKNLDEIGKTSYIVPSAGKTKKGKPYDMEIRIMDGRTHPDPSLQGYYGNRVITTKKGTKDYLQPSGSQMPKGMPIDQRRLYGHTQLMSLPEINLKFR
jgi:hypothetical protein